MSKLSNGDGERRRARWPKEWYGIVALSVFVYLVPVWIDTALPAPVQYTAYSVQDPVVVGHPLLSVAERCNTTKGLQAYSLVRSLQNVSDMSETVLESGQAIAAPGCRTVHGVVTPLVEGIPPGKYRMLIIITSQGFFRQVEQPLVSGEFDVRGP